MLINGVNYSPKRLNYRAPVWLSLLLVTFAGASFGAEALALPPAPPDKEWRQVWGDEFEGDAVDESKWNVQHNSNYGAGNREDQCYMRDNVSVSGGMLRLTAKRETVECGNETNPDTGDSTYYFTSGMVTTRQQQGEMKYKFTKGYIEARIRTPKGNPYWAGFWLPSPADGSTPSWPDYGEFDIAEIYGKRPDQTTGTFHYACTPHDHCQTEATSYNITTEDSYPYSGNRGAIIDSQASFDAYPEHGGVLDFHVYGFLWEDERITWYIDGEPFRYFDGEDVMRINPDGSTTKEGYINDPNIRMGEPTEPFETIFAYPHSIILNLAIGGNGPRYDVQGDAYTGEEGSDGYEDGNLVAEMPASMDVDYVRVYQLKPEADDQDAGINEPDAGAEEPDASADEPDAARAQDAAASDTEQADDVDPHSDAQPSGDAGARRDADATSEHGSGSEDTAQAPDVEGAATVNGDSGCGCDSSAGPWPSPLAALLALLVGLGFRRARPRGL